jgi:hypothetical protein
MSDSRTARYPMSGRCDRAAEGTTQKHSKTAALPHGVESLFPHSLRATPVWGRTVAQTCLLLRTGLGPRERRQRETL